MQKKESNRCGPQRRMCVCVCDICELQAHAKIEEILPTLPVFVPTRITSYSVSLYVYGVPCPRTEHTHPSLPFQAPILIHSYLKDTDTLTERERQRAELGQAELHTPCPSFSPHHFQPQH